MGTFHDALGVYDRAKKTIIVKRSQLGRLDEYAGTLLHETAHATSGREDVTRNFELELSRLLGLVAAIAINKDFKSS